MENFRQDPDNGQRQERREELDAKELIRRHIEDPDHEITDEDIRNVKVGVSDDAPLVGAEAMARIDEREEAGIPEDEHNADEAVTDDDVDHDDVPTTPWDVKE